MLQNREKILESLKTGHNELNGERGAERAIGNAIKNFSRIADKAGGRLDDILSCLDRAAMEVSEAVAQLESLLTDDDLDPQGLERLEERLFALRALARKHNIPVEELGHLRFEMGQRLALIDDHGDLLTRLTREENQARAAYAEKAKALSAERGKVAKKLALLVNKELPPLKLEKARFEVQIETLDEVAWNENGIDRVTFLVATNPGQDPGPLHKIASGGELARFTLAIKVVLAATGTAPTLVFDEVDTGIGGAVADAVGERLARLAENVQVLVVTHSPQVAARGNHHWRVEKSTKGGAVTTSLTVLDMPARCEEIARMLSGSTITDAARKAAESLLHNGGAEQVQP